MIVEGIVWSRRLYSSKVGACLYCLVGFGFWSRLACVNRMYALPCKIIEKYCHVDIYVYNLCIFNFQVFGGLLFLAFGIHAALEEI